VAKSPKSRKETAKDPATDNSKTDEVEDAVIVGDGEVTQTPGEDDAKAEPSSEPETEAAAEDDTDAVAESNGESEDATPESEAPWGSSEAKSPVEDKPQPEDNDAPATAMPVVAEPKSSSGGGTALGGMVLGGLIAGFIGFGIAQFMSGGWPFETTEADPMRETVAAQSDEIAALRERVDAQAQEIESLGADSSVEELGDALRANILATQSRIDELTATVNGFEERLTTLEKMPSGDSSEAAETAAAAYERELADMRAMLDRELENLRAQQEDAEALQANAAQSAQAASARAALSRIMAALDSGQPFDDALFDLTTATGAEAPDGLANVANDGVPTLGALQESFPEMARAALDDSLRAMVEAGEIGRGEAFLRTQLGTRSLEPQEGDDPDAILSRAEFELQNGRIAQALSELEAMPEAAQPAMDDWIARARTRLVALEAGSSLADTLNQ